MSIKTYTLCFTRPQLEEIYRCIKENDDEGYASHKTILDKIARRIYPRDVLLGL